MRFENASIEAVDLTREIVGKYFPELINAEIKVVFDTKKRMKGGKIVLGRITKSNDIIRLLSLNDTIGEGYDYVMFLDKTVFENIDKEDKVRLIRHELRHCFVDSEARKPYKIIDHDIEDFLVEIELNKDEPKWAERVALVAESLYDKEGLEDEEEEE